MIDMPPEPVQAQVQVIQRELVKCGVKANGFTVKYEDELQSIEIVISHQAGATPDKFDCIRNAAQHEIVTFEDTELQEGYSAQIAELLRPKMLKDAEEGLKKRGLLKDFPERANFTSDKLFAEALETHCGVKRGSFFVESQGGLIAQPQSPALSGPEWEQMTCLMNAMMYVSAKGEVFKLGFVGNEQFSDPDH
jgi:hypothetical protein